MPLKTPGVYIVEKNAFPNSVVEVATAVPAFIGHTERADNKGKSLRNKPWRISSMAEFITYFGGPAAPVLTFGPVPDPAPAAPPPTAARGQTAGFDHNGRAYQVAQAAGRAGGRYLLYRAMQHFFQNGGGACYIVSVGGYGDDIAAGDATTGLIGALAPLAQEQEPTLVVVPEAVLLDQPGCMRVQQQVLAHCGALRSRVALLDVWGGDRARADATPGGDCIDHFRNDIGTDHLDYAAAYWPWLHTGLVQAADMHFGLFPGSLADLASLLKVDLGITAASMAGDAKLKVIGEAIDRLPYTDAQWVQHLRDDARQSPRLHGLADLDRQLADPVQAQALLATQRQLLHKTLCAVSPLYNQAMDAARGLLNVMPPSPAMAGVYTMVDNNRGVWKAPANLSLASVVAPTVALSDSEQGDLNVPPGGKSINAIRSFIGEGVLVWGARTLDGNSLDWRYVNVRRTMIMLEQSCLLAARAYVFEPNVANTWVTIKSMIANFLTSVWKRGGLAGAVPDDAFSVHVGLGETMTPEDVLAGTLRVTVRVAVSRPAEFIEITFEQQMQGA